MVSISILKESSMGTTSQRPTSTTTKLFPLTSTTTPEVNHDFVIITDPANAWSNTSNNNKSYDTIDRNNDIDNKTNGFGLSDNISDIMKQTSLRGISSSDVAGTASYGGTMQFDMDDLILPGSFQLNHPTATFNMNNNISSVVSIIDGGSTGGGDNNEIVEDDLDEHDEIDTVVAKQSVKDAIALMDKIEIDRIPCPRLCGATFGPGVGRLAGKYSTKVKKYIVIIIFDSFLLFL